jgi:hypothetical protein
LFVERGDDGSSEEDRLGAGCESLKSNTGPSLFTICSLFLDISDGEEKKELALELYY